MKTRQVPWFLGLSLMALAGCAPASVALQPSSTIPPTNVHTPTRTPRPTRTPSPTPTATATSWPTPPMAMKPFSAYISGITVAMDVPSDWKGTIQPGSGETSMTFKGMGAMVEIYVADLEDIGYGATTQEEYAASDLAWMQENMPEFALISRASGTNAHGLAVEHLVATQNPGTPITLVRLIHLHGDATTIVVTYFVVSSSFEDFERMIDYSLSTLSVEE